jgi:hypothetical protein
MSADHDVAPRFAAITQSGRKPLPKEKTPRNDGSVDRVQIDHGQSRGRLRAILDAELCTVRPDVSGDAVYGMLPTLENPQVTKFPWRLL